MDTTTTVTATYTIQDRHLRLTARQTPKRDTPTMGFLTFNQRAFEAVAHAGNVAGYIEGRTAMARTRFEPGTLEGLDIVLLFDIVWAGGAAPDADTLRKVCAEIGVELQVFEGHRPGVRGASASR